MDGHALLFEPTVGHSSLVSGVCVMRVLGFGAEFPRLPRLAQVAFVVDVVDGFSGGFFRGCVENEVIGLLLLLPQAGAFEFFA